MTEPIVPQNGIKRMLREGSGVFGTMVVEFRQPSVMQLLSHAGFDFVIIDSEHGPFSMETVADLSRAARMHGVTPIVRIPEVSYSAVTRPLDAGAQGIMIPRVTNPTQVRNALSMMKYPPAGERGSVVGRGHTNFLSGKIDEVTASANNESMIIVQIETRQALEQLDDILTLKGVDAALVGPTDLSVALGVPGEMNHPALVEAISKILGACQQHGVVPALHMNDIDLAVHWSRRGMRMVSFSAETSMLMKAGREAVTVLRGSAGR
jgi:2-keto-3-deoxy-L-rhamnonate aldolase RhmA